MGLPSIDITFKTLGMTAIQRSQKGIVAVILEDAAGAGAHVMTQRDRYPVGARRGKPGVSGAGVTGYVNPPRQA